MPTPARRPAQRPAPASRPPTPRGEGFATALKILATLGLIGGAGRLAYKQYLSRQQAEPAAEIPKSKPVEKPPEIKVSEEPKPVVPADRPVKPVEEPKPVETPKLAALPALPELNKSEALPALVAATRARIADGRWNDHAAVLKTAAIATINGRARTAGPVMLDKLSEKQALPLALAQLDIIALLGEKGLGDFAGTGEGFADRLLTTPAMAESFVNDIKPENRPSEVLRVWQALDAWEMTPADKERWRNLAFALALIHGKPGGENRAAEVYAYYRKAGDAHRLYEDFTKIKPDELVWAVGDHAFTLKDQEWALKNVSFPLARLGAAYPSIAYRMNHAPYPEYTMENVLKMGGICMNQGQYAQGNGRARGVPCAYITGEGSRGGHAWFGYRTDRGWINNVGRYADGYACGRATDPQTGKPFREWDFFLFNDPGRRNGDLEASRRLIRAAGVIGESGDAAGKLDLLEAAAHRDAGNPLGWRTWIAALLDDKRERPPEFWQKIVGEYRVVMKECPDYFDVSDRIESEKIFPKLDPDRIGEFLRKRRRQSIRDNPARFDLLTDSVKREADFYQSRKDDNRIGLLYAGALREYGKNLPTFIRLAEDFGARAADNAAIRKNGLSVLESTFNKDVDSKLKGDAFALAMQAKVAKKVSEIFAADGDARKAAKYAARADEIDAKATAEHEAMR